MVQKNSIWPEKKQRVEQEDRITRVLADAMADIPDHPVTPEPRLADIRKKLSGFDFTSPVATEKIAEQVIGLLKGGMVHTMHPGYMGLFNPSVTFPSVLADRITAQFNPQLAVWSHAPVPVEIERHVIKSFGHLYGWTDEEAAGHFTSGGAEANFTAILAALTRACPDYSEQGIRALSGEPRIYVSRESHLAWLKIAHHTGLGRAAVRLVETDGQGQMETNALAARIEADKKAGDQPVCLAATAGTTNAGMIDPLDRIARIARAENLWFHVDAAWGGAGYVSPRCRPALKGIEKADSITLDAHKWLAVPMGAGMFLCRDEALLGETFRVSASYMPEHTEDAADPYTHSLQWSRRFSGLKLFMSLAALGWDGYRAHIEHSLDMAEALRQRLEDNDWRVVNDSKLAVVCFIDAREQISPEQAAAAVVREGSSWVSTTHFAGRKVLRACITSHRTRKTHLDRLIASLNRARASA